MEALQPYASGLRAWYDNEMEISKNYISAKWFLMDSPVLTLQLTAAYLFIVLIGPRIMKNRNAFGLFTFMRVYNVAIAVLNAHIVYELVVNSLFAQRMRITCSTLPVQALSEDTVTPANRRIAAALWWYYFSKVLEYADTFCFILRKKNNQISFLHVYHHSTMFPLWWMGVRWAPGGHSVWGAIVNSSVHVLMYGYYFLATFKSMRPYLWWKRYMTQIQLTQFFMMLGNTVGALYAYKYILDPPCRFHVWMGWALFTYLISLIVLFSLFYRQAYIKPKKGDAVEAKKTR